MTIHKLTSPGARRTVCTLTVPDILKTDRTSATWDDGDEQPGDCPECAVVVEAAAFVGPKRFAVFSVRKGTLVRAGSAVANRDGTMNVYLDVLPIDGQLKLKPD